MHPGGIRIYLIDGNAGTAQNGALFGRNCGVHLKPFNLGKQYGVHPVAIYRVYRSISRCCVQVLGQDLLSVYDQCRRVIRGREAITQEEGPSSSNKGISSLCSLRAMVEADGSVPFVHTVNNVLSLSLSVCPSVVRRLGGDS